MAQPMRGGAVAALGRFARKTWVRASLFTVVAIAFALAAGFLGALIPFRLVIDLGQDSVGSVLQILASSMLAVTTFSLTAMVTAYSSATTIATPRATQLLVEDRTSQNVLATFVGSFVFSLVGIVALSTGYYTEQGRTILFFGTLAVIALIVVSLLRWIAHLTHFGRMGDVIDRVEAAASAALAAYARAPTLGAHRLTDIPDGTHAVTAETPGYVTHVDVAALNRVALRADVLIYVTASPGRTADGRRPLVLVAGGVDDEVRSAVRRAFRVQPHRDFEQDPRLGVIALAEIGSRALSPATNDPGTAIDVLAALGRVFAQVVTADVERDVRHERIWIAPPRLSDLLDDAFRPLARDGAGIVEVQIRLQKCLAGLAAVAPRDEEVQALARVSANALRRSIPALDRVDRRALRSAHHAVWTGSPAHPGWARPPAGVPHP